jgi:hypothetical protein
MTSGARSPGRRCAGNSADRFVNGTNLCCSPRSFRRSTSDLERAAKLAVDEPATEPVAVAAS